MCPAGDATPRAKMLEELDQDVFTGIGSITESGVTMELIEVAVPKIIVQ